ncbi:hsp70 family protein [Mycolicibacterium hassiacum DSM 44199]|uniref:Hsp70 family protein n=1 Tax=Mycolicibacterium hassiacum (strain DSM 44199 / CIP 105218 / JCM 12690 / 3849) TaxID=1122247 RepID=K5BI17_MYCHD|nr:hsp70 family protein [Mycolicibacterium hassiacum DSM 44199]
MGLSIGTSNLVAARVGNQPVTRRSAVTLSDGFAMTGFVERVGDPVPLVAPDGSTHRAERLLVDALAELAGGAGVPSADIAIAIPAHWGGATVRALRDALAASAVFTPHGRPTRLVSDAIAALTSLNAHPGLVPHGVVALLDFGGGGTGITLADATSSFEPIGESVRYAEFSGDLIDQALLSHVLDTVASTGAVDPAATAAVGALARLREACRAAKERLTYDTSTELVVELPGHRSTLTLHRGDLESLISASLDGALDALSNALQRNGISWSDVVSVVTVGGGAGIPLIARRLAERVEVPVLTTPRPGLDAATGAALYAAYGPAAEAETGVAPAVAEPESADATLAAPMVAEAADAPALAWSQEEPTEEPAPFVAESFDNEYRYDTGPASSRQPVQYLPADSYDDAGWHRVPLTVFGVAAAVALVAVGGVAIALTASTTTEPPPTSVPPQHVKPAPPPETVTVISELPPPPPVTEPPAAPPPPPPVTQHPVAPAPAAPPPTTTTTSTTTTTTTTTTPTTTTTTTTVDPGPTSTSVPTATTTPMTTAYLTVPFVPVPIPIPVPQN